MPDMSFFETDDQRAEFGLAQPLRHLAAQYSSFGLRPDLALAGDDEHEGQTIEMSMPQKIRECVVRACLGHAMQIEASFDLLLST